MSPSVLFTWHIISLHLKMSVRHVYILACGRLTDPGVVHFFILNSCVLETSKVVVHNAEPSLLGLLGLY